MLSSLLRLKVKLKLDWKTNCCCLSEEEMANFAPIQAVTQAVQVCVCDAAWLCLSNL